MSSIHTLKEISRLYKPHQKGPLFQNSYLKTGEAKTDLTCTNGSQYKTDLSKVFVFFNNHFKKPDLIVVVYRTWFDYDHTFFPE